MSFTKNLQYGIKTVPEMIREEIDDYMQERMKLTQPAVVTDVSNYESTQCVDVKTLITNVYDDGTTTEQLNLQKIFVQLQEGNGFKIKLPIAVGDEVVLHYTHRSLTSWLQGNGESVSEDIEQSFGNKDCFITHGFGTRKSNQSPSKDNLIIEGDNTTITITPAGEVTVTTSGTSTITSAGHTINADTTINGNVTVNGNSTISGNNTVSGTATAPTVVAQTSLTVAGTEMDQHVHSDVAEGTDNSGPPV